MAETVENAIVVEDLVYSVDGRRILDGLSLAVGRGEIVGIIGASGSGKSTLIKCMAGLLRGDSGSILLDGRQLVGTAERQMEKMRSQVGFVFQYSALFDSMTVFENIALAPMRRRKYSRQQAQELVHEKLAMVQLGAVEGYYPSQLSGGMAKRVGLARALALQPHVLFYDEPTSGLDPPTARSIDRLIVRVRKEIDVTSVVVSHDLNALARIADRLALLEEGKIVLVAGPEEFMQSKHPLVIRFVEAGMNGHPQGSS